MTDQRENDLGQPIGAPVPDWQPCPRPPRSAMEGRCCRIEPLAAARHAEALFAAISADTDGRSWTYMGYGPFGDLDQYRAWIAADAAGDDPLFHAIIDKVGGRPLGVASYLRIEPKVGVIEVGHIHYAPALQRSLVATEAMFLMMRRVFDELGYRRYEWKCDALNEASRRAALRLGFQFEGIFRQATLYKGRNRDTAWFAVVDQDWPALRAGYQAWLDPGNFDASGRQRRALADCLTATRSGG